MNVSKKTTDSDEVGKERCLTNNKLQLDRIQTHYLEEETICTSLHQLSSEVHHWQLSSFVLKFIVRWQISSSAYLGCQWNRRH